MIWPWSTLDNNLILQEKKHRKTTKRMYDWDQNVFLKNRRLEQNFERRVFFS